jgi:hypothetical protein
MLNIRDTLVVVGCVFAGFVTSAGPGLVARAAEPPRDWFEHALAAADSSTDGGAAERRIAQLEQQLKALEAERSAAAATGSTPRELEAVLSQNRDLAARNRTLAAENQALAQSHLFESPSAAAACEPPPSAADPRAQIRYWAQQLRDSGTGFRGRLTVEQSAAVQVLLRPERELDPRNPWREPGRQALASAK